MLKFKEQISAEAIEAVLLAAGDSINEDMIDWGTGTKQVSQDDVVDGITYKQYNPAAIVATGTVNVGSNTTGQNQLINATLGTELLTWGAVAWNEDGATWTFAADTLTHVTGNTTTVTATLGAAIVAGRTYKVTITGTGGGATAIYTLGGVTGTTIAASGAIVITDYITASTTGSLIITPANTCTVAITNISVKALTDATGDLTVQGNIYARSQILASGTLNKTSGVYPYYSFAGDSDTGVDTYLANYVGFYGGGLLLGYMGGGTLYTSATNLVLSDANVYRDATNVAAIKNATAQNTLRIYNTADTHPTLTNYERLSLTGVQGASVNITAETAGTGADNINVIVTPAGTGTTQLVGKTECALQTKTVSTTPVTLTTNEVRNGIIFVTTGASVINLPAGSAALDGAFVRFIAIAAVTFSIQPNGSEIIILNGTALTAGYGIGTDGAIDTQFGLVYDATATRWRTVGISGIVSDIGA